MASPLSHTHEEVEVLTDVYLHHPVRQRSVAQNIHPTRIRATGLYMDDAEYGNHNTFCVLFTMTSRLGRNGCFVLSERMSFAIADATGDVLSLLSTWSLNTSLMPGLRVCTRHFGTTGHRTMSNPASIEQGVPSGSCFLSRRSGPTGQRCVPRVASAHGITTCTRAQSATRLSGYWGTWLALLATVVFGKIGLKRIAAWRFLV